MAEDEKSGRGSTWAVWTAVALVLYVLSVGPLVGLNARLGQPGWMESVLVVYLPVAAICQAPAIHPVFEAYLLWWHELGRSGRP